MFLPTKLKKWAVGTIWEDYWKLGSEKNLTEMSKDAVGVTYHPLHNFLTEASQQRRAP